MPGASSQGAAAAPPSADNWFTAWSAATPLLTRALVLIIVPATLVGLFLDLTFLAMSPAVFLRGQVWRLVSNFFDQGGLLSGLFIVLQLVQQAPMLERAGGTLNTAVLVFLLGLLANLAFGGASALAYGLAPSFSAVWFGWPPLAQGLWPVFLALLTTTSLADPHGSATLFCWTVPKRTLPYIVLALFCLLSFAIRLELVAGLVLGLAHSKGYLSKIWPSSRRLVALEEGALTRWGLVRLPGYVRSADAGLPQTSGGAGGVGSQGFAASGGRSSSSSGARPSGGGPRIATLSSTPSADDEAGRRGADAATAAGALAYLFRGGGSGGASADGSDAAGSGSSGSAGQQPQRFGGSGSGASGGGVRLGSAPAAATTASASARAPAPSTAQAPASRSDRTSAAAMRAAAAEKRLAAEAGKGRSAGGGGGASTPTTPGSNSSSSSSSGAAVAGAAKTAVPPPAAAAVVQPPPAGAAKGRTAPAPAPAPEDDLLLLDDEDDDPDFAAAVAASRLEVGGGSAGSSGGGGDSEGEGESATLLGTKPRI